MNQASRNQSKHPKEPGDFTTTLRIVPITFIAIARKKEPVSAHSAYECRFGWQRQVIRFLNNQAAIDELHRGSAVSPTASEILWIWASAARRSVP
jgi:hypothetical protein